MPEMMKNCFPHARHCFWIAFGLAAGVFGAASTPAQAAPPPGYTLVWSDEFHQGVGAAPDPAVWGYNTGGGGWGNGELETYVNDREHAQIVAHRRATDGQALQILATNTHGYESARLLTEGKRSFQYGFIEARITLPYGQGIWPAFWMLGTNIGQVGWPACGEIDIMENLGQKSWWGHNLSSLHGGSAGNAHANFTKNAPYDLPPGRTFHDGYHLFQMLWAKDAISFYIDGTLFQTRTAAEYGATPWPFNAPFFFILNAAIGGDWPGKPDATTVFPQKMLVDYIRVYQGASQVPAPPTGLTARPGDGGQIRLSWAGDVGATSYRLYRSAKHGQGGGIPLQADITRTSFTDKGVVAATKYYYKVAAVNDAGVSRPSVEVTATPARVVEAPYGGKPWLIPGTIQMEDYDSGGEGRGFHDTDVVNRGGLARPDLGVDIEECSDAGGGYCVGYTAAGEWLRYTVQVATAGQYGLAFRVASSGQGGTFHVEDAQGRNLTGPVRVPDTGGWQKWMTVQATVTLPAGRQTLRLVEETGGYNLNAMTFTRP